jgi:hypothetical protein
MLYLPELEVVVEVLTLLQELLRAGVEQEP